MIKRIIEWCKKFFKGTETKKMSEIEPTSIDDYIEIGGYEGVKESCSHRG